ncbi:type II toxin-antitoxin system Phd/YefM family antitoxin [Hyphococcus sp.]|uniref:type II toxin-antitoxin system Phd/YefM family antitoxin n=1 Tax=Hyphococcus sp. TaxID=2038636 RepID=UPI003CCBF4E5
MQLVSAYDARRRFSALLIRARQEPVAITRYNRPAAYLISPREFRDFRRFQHRTKLEEMTRLVARLEAAGHNAPPGLYRELERLTKQANATLPANGA